MTKLTFSNVKKFEEFCQEFTSYIEYCNGTTAVLKELTEYYEMLELQEVIEAEYEKYFTYTF